MSTLTRRVTTVASAGALLLGGAVATASTASATTTSKACTHAAKLNTYVDATVKFRTGPGGTAKGQLAKNTRIYYACYKGNWGYVKALSGVHKNETGWVSRDYIPIPMQLD
ncbi:SH3 domain-containing protein [Streptomyces sp. NPDC047072]|uniref:SH3 domain-containing protein n=1 Tax=Streptomyces sp. NPDC047072 TaxID=3154809 RepID=UPI0033DB9B3A